MLSLSLEDVRDIKDMEKVDTSSWNEVSKNIRLRLLNKKVVELYGEDIAFKEIFDLAMTVSLQERTSEKIRSHMLTNKELEELGVTIDEALSKAISNSENDMNKRIMPLREMLMNKGALYAPISSTPMQGPIMMQQGSNPLGTLVNDVTEDNENVLIVSSSKGKLGASYGMLTSTINEIWERFEKDNFYIVPMSTDEMMYIRESYATNNGKKPIKYVEDDILDMLELSNQKINGDWKNIMSYRAYYYSGDDGNKLMSIKR